MKINFTITALMASSLFLLGCSTTAQDEQMRDELYHMQGQNTEQSSSNRQTRGTYEDIVVEVETLNEESVERSFSEIMVNDLYDGTMEQLTQAEIEQIRENQLVLFDFDSSEIKNTVLSTLDTQINILLNNPNLRVMLEGRTDERGPREYNLLLSERRSNSVKNHLVEAGINPEQILVIGLGKNEPLFLSEKDNTEYWWSLNRSVYFKFIER